MTDATELTATEQAWDVGIIAQTISGEVLLKMTDDQAAELRDRLIWLTEDNDD